MARKEHNPGKKQEESSSTSSFSWRNALLAGATLVLLVGVFVVLSQFGGGSEAAAPATTSSQASTSSQSSSPLASVGEPMIATESHMLERPSGSPPNVGDEAPDFVYTLTDGTTHQLSDLRGKRVLINFWATWCPPCMAEMPDIQAAYEQYGDDDFMVLAVNSAEEQARVEAFAAELGLTIPLITNEAGDIGTGYGARNLPTSYFVDRDGTISYRHTGIMTTDFIQQRIEEMQ